MLIQSKNILYKFATHFQVYHNNDRVSDLERRETDYDTLFRYFDDTAHEKFYAFASQIFMHVLLHKL